MLRSAGKNIFGRFRDVPGRVLSWILCLCLIFQTVGVSQAATGASVEQKKQETNIASSDESGLKITVPFSILLADYQNDLLGGVGLYDSDGSLLEDAVITVTNIDRILADGITVDEGYSWIEGTNLISPSESEDGMTYAVTYSASHSSVSTPVVSTVKLEVIALKNASAPLKLVDVLDEDSTHVGMETAVLVNGLSVESSDFKPVERENAEVFVRLSNIRIKENDPKVPTNGVQDATVYSFGLPDNLIPCGIEATDEPLNVWIPLQQSFGKARAWGRLVLEGSNFNFQIFFLDTEGEEDITADYQYNAKLPDTFEGKDSVPVEFEKYGSYSIPLVVPAEPLLVEKNAQWLDSEGNLLNSSVGGNVYRQIKYTLTVLNPDPTQPLSISLTETLESSGMVMLLPSSGYEKFLEVKTVSGKSESAVSLNGVGNFSFSGSSGSGKITVDGSSTGGFSAGSGTVSADKLQINIENINADKVELSYIVDVYYTAAMSGSSRSYKAVTSYESNGEEVKVPVTATKNISSPGFSFNHNDCKSSAFSSGYSGRGDLAEKVSAYIYSGGEDWIKVTESGINPDSLNQISSMYLYACNFSRTNDSGLSLKNDFSAGTYSNQSLISKAKPVYSGSFSGLINYVKNSDNDPVAAAEMQEIYNQNRSWANFDSSTGVVLYSAEQDQLVSYGSRSKNIYMLISPVTVYGATYCCSSSAGANASLSYNSTNLGLAGNGNKELLGSPLGFELYMFNLPENQGSYNASVSYSKYLRKVIESTGPNGENTVENKSPYNYNFATYLAVENACTLYKSSISHPLSKGPAYVLNKNGFVQEDGSIRWDLSIDLTAFIDWYKWRQSTGTAAPIDSIKAALYDVLPSGYSWGGSAYDENGMLVTSGSSSNVFQGGYIYLAAVKPTPYTQGEISGAPHIDSVPADGWSYASASWYYDNAGNAIPNKYLETISRNSGGARWIFYDGYLSYYIRNMLNSNSDKTVLRIRYITMPNYSVSDIGNLTYNNYADFQIYDGHLEAPVYDVVGSGSAVVPGISGKTMNVSTENNADNELNKFVATVSSTFAGQKGFSGVYKISDNMSQTTVKDDSGKTLAFSPAKYITLTDMKVSFAYDSGPGENYNTVLFDESDFETAKTTGHVEKDVTPYNAFYGPLSSVAGSQFGDDSVKVRLEYSGDMERGFTVTIYGLTARKNGYEANSVVRSVTVAYNGIFDIKKYSEDNGLRGLLKIELKNAAARSYRAINNNGRAYSASLKSFSYSASPVLKKEWTGSDKGKGHYKNDYRVTADVGPQGQKKVYLVDQINRVKEYYTSGSAVSGSGAPDYLFDADDPKTQALLSKFLSYVTVENIKIQVGDNRLTLFDEDNPNKLVTIYENEKAVPGTGYSISSLGNTAEERKNQLLSLGVEVPEKTTDNEKFQNLTGNLYAFEVSKTDGTALSNELYFVITYTLLLGENEVNVSFRTDSEIYHKGYYEIDSQAAIAYPGKVDAGSSISLYSADPSVKNTVPTVKAMYSAARHPLSKKTMPIAGPSESWVSAGAAIMGNAFLEPATGVKGFNAETNVYTAKVHTGNIGDENDAPIYATDSFYVHALIDGKAVTDDELNRKLSELILKHTTVERIREYLVEENGTETELYPKDERVDNNPEYRFTIPSDSEIVYIPADENYTDLDESELKGYGEAVKEMFSVSGEHFPWNADVYFTYRFNIDWVAVMMEAAKEGLLKNGEVLTIGTLNKFDGNFPDTGSSYEFKNPIDLLGTIGKNADVDVKNNEITWSLELNVNGDIDNYSVEDSMSAGDGKKVTENDKIAFAITEFRTFEIYDNSDPENPHLLYSYDGSFEPGTSVTIRDAAGCYKGAKLTLNDEGIGFCLEFAQLMKSSLKIVYTTGLDEKQFLANGGNLSEGYSVTNFANAGLPGGMLDIETSGNVKKEEDSLFEKTAEDTGLAHEQAWRLRAETGSNDAEDITISDSLTADSSIKKYLNLSSMKVTLYKDSVSTVIFDSEAGIDELSAYSGEWEKYSVKTNGETDFTLRFDSLEKGTAIVLDYVTSLDMEAVGDSSIKKDSSYSLSNSAAFSRYGWDNMTSKSTGKVVYTDAVSKSGELLKERNEQVYTDNGEPIIKWSVDFHLEEIASQGEIAELGSEAAATVTDNLPFGLRCLEDSIVLYDLTAGKSGFTKSAAPIPADEYNITSIGRDFVITLRNPSEHMDVRLEFNTAAYASLDNVKNSVTVEIAGKTAGTESKNITGVFLKMQSGTVYSVSKQKISFEAQKYIDGTLLVSPSANQIFSFKAVQVDEDLTTPVEDGYSDEAQNGEDGYIYFKETDYLGEGVYYFKIYEVKEKGDTLNYELDDSEYIVRVNVVRNATDYEVTTEAFLNETASDAVIFNNSTLHTLTVSKGVDGEAGETDVDFGFSVYLEDAEGNPVSGEFPFAKGKGTPVLGTETIKFNASGKAEFSLKADESAVIYKLPDGYSYEVTETDADKNGYETEVPKSAEGTIDGQNAAAEFINSRDEGSLVITKTIESTTGVINRDKSFKFTLKFSDGYGEELTDADEVYTYVVTDSEGTVASGSVKSGGSIYLSHGQTAKINGLPNGTQCTVTEEETADDGYTARKAELSTEIHASNASGDRVDFINDYKADGKLSGSASLNIDKVLKGRKDDQWLETDEFEFVLSAKAGDSATVDGVADGTVMLPPSVVINSKTTDASGRHTAAFGDITFSKAGDYVFTVTEYRNGKPVDDKDRIDGITFAAPLEIKVTVTDTGTGELSAAVTNTTAAQDGSSAKPYVFTNTYTVDELEADITVSGTKTLTGDRTFMPGDEFTFTMTSLDGAPLPKTTSVTVKPETDSEGRVVNNSFTFGGENDKITYAAPGTYFYLIREEKPVKDLIPGMNYDSRIYVLTVSVTDNNDGTMTASQSLSVLPEAGGTAGNEADSADFTNTYNSKEALAEIDGIKALDGKELSAGEFGFVLEAEDGTPMPEGFTSKDGVARKDIVNGAGGIIHFGDIKFTVADAGVGKAAAKTYVYTVTEKQPTDDGTFEGKALDGAVLEDSRWVYRGVTYDSSVKTVSVSVWTEDIVDSNGIVTQTVFADVKGNEFAFRNSYSAEGTLEGETYLKVSKSLTGREWNENDEFAFVLAPYDADTESAVKDGSVVLPSNTEIKINFRTAALTEAFGNIKFYAEGKYRFRVSELNGGSRIDGVTYDGEAYVFTVTVTDEDFNGTFTVKAEGAEADGRFEFANTYTVDELEADISVSGSKVLKGREFKDGDKFYFAMTAKDGAPLPKKSLAILTPSPDGSGSLFCFGGKDDPIVFTEPGSYEYLIYELSSDMPGVANIEGVNYDAAVYRLTVNVKDNGDGTMSVESSKFEVSSDGSGEEWTSADASNADFTNTYFFDVDSVVIDALKALTGRQLNEGEFTFVLEAEEGVPMPEGSEKTADGLVGFEAHNLSDGGVLFDGIVFTPENAGASAEDAAVYTYTVREKQPTADGTFDGEALDGAVLVDGRWVYKGVTYDNSVYTVTVKVQTGEEIGDDGVKVQKTYVDMEDVEITFTNSYRATGTLNGSANLVVSKKLSGRQWNGNDKFLFVLEGGDDATLDAIEEGRIILPEITQLEITQLTEGYAAAFGDIVFNEEGLWNFVIYEIEGSEKGMTYDTKVRKIAVNVVDESFDGIYTVTVSGNSKEELAFTNVYADIKQDAPDVPDTPKTGDSSFPAAWAFLAVTSAICFAAACRKRKEEEA